MVWLSVLKDNKSKQEKQTRLVDYQVIKQKKSDRNFFRPLLPLGLLFKFGWC